MYTQLVKIDQNQVKVSLHPLLMEDVSEILHLQK